MTILRQRDLLNQGWQETKEKGQKYKDRPTVHLMQPFPVNWKIFLVFSTNCGIPPQLRCNSSITLWPIDRFLQANLCACEGNLQVVLQWHHNTSFNNYKPQEISSVCKETYEPSKQDLYWISSHSKHCSRGPLKRHATQQRANFNRLHNQRE